MILISFRTNSEESLSAAALADSNYTAKYSAKSKAYIIFLTVAQVLRCCLKAIPHDPCESVCAASTGVEAQIIVRSPKFDAGLQAKFTSLYATSRRIDVIFDDVGNHDGKLASR